MPRSAPGPATGLPNTRTLPVVAGNCGRSPAISRKIVDFPQPDGPRIVMNSPLPGKSSTRNVTFLIAVKPSSYVFETPSNSTIGGLIGSAGRGSASALTPTPIAADTGTAGSGTTTAGDRSRRPAAR